MSKTIKRYSLILVILLIGIFAIACSNNEEQAPNASSVTFGNGEATYALIEKGAVVLAPTVVPANARQQTFAWSSSDTSVATVDQEGKVTPIKAGKVDISASLQDTSFVATHTLQVYNAATGIEITGKTNELHVGDSTFNTTTLNTKVLPETANQEIRYSSSNPSSVAVNPTTGVVTATAYNTKNVTITAEILGDYTIDGQSIREEYQFDLYTSPTGVVLNFVDNTESEIYVGGPTTKLAATVNASTAKQDVTWSVSDESVLAISNGVVTANPVTLEQPAIVNVTATTTIGNKSKSQPITVYAAPTNLTIAKPFPKPQQETNNDEEVEDTIITRRIAKNSALQLGASIQPAAAKQTIEWTTSDETIGTVDKQGIFTAVGLGEVEITAEDYFGVKSDVIKFIVEENKGYYDSNYLGDINSVVGSEVTVNPLLVIGTDILRADRYFIADTNIVNQVGNLPMFIAINAGQTKINIGTSVVDGKEGEGNDTDETMLWYSTFFNFSAITRANDFVNKYNNLNDLTVIDINGYDDSQFANLSSTLTKAIAYQQEIETLEPEYTSNTEFVNLTNKIAELYEIVQNSINDRIGEDVKNFIAQMQDKLVEVARDRDALVVEVALYVEENGTAPEQEKINEFTDKANAFVSAVQSIQELIQAFDNFSDESPILEQQLLDDFNAIFDGEISKLDTVFNTIQELQDTLDNNNI
ncbi:MAG: Ig-like domain-containing protein [Firmicutes bacterium]|nr:Ig-like domain-containing protein [Bacillota bacterium]